ncbi:MAG: DCC1-like thiol-disulfide oxidoreductase family protein [Phycisphaerales bacterium]|nr:DCC1-like thiol-disulfide oxidoreductase family protein [Phycisphaerales bacterium]
MRDQGPILFYDGECGMCQKVVRFSIARDRKKLLKFAPINGETWKAVTEEPGQVALTTVYLLDDHGDLSMRTTAVCRLLFILGGIWSVLGGILWIIPRPLRNLGYRFVAKNRYRISGKVDACSIPAPDDMDRLLH